jgi:D-hexose-6-phosphate mutarotase
MQVQPKSRQHFSYIGEIAHRLNSMSWAFYEPKFGHLLQISHQLALHFEATITIESDATCQDFLQTYWKIQNIQETLTKAIEHLSSSVAIPSVQGYYASITEGIEATQQKALFHKQYTLFDLLRTGSQLQVAVFEF